MAITVTTSDPRGLLADIKKGIDAGTIITWKYDTDGDFTHSPTQFANRAWLRPVVAPGELLLIIVPPIKIHMSREVYAIFHGRFVEMLLAHFDTRFSVATTTALPSHGDSVGA